MWSTTQNTYTILKLNKDEWNYSTTEQEGFGMIFTLQKYHHYLFANLIISLRIIKLWNTQLTNPWTMEEYVDGLFQEFEFEIVVWLKEV